MPKSNAEQIRQRKEEALELAQLIYDIYKEGQSDDKIKDGQNNANQPENE